MSLDANQLAKAMLEAFSSELSDRWSDVKNYAESEAKKLAENFVMIEKMKAAGEIDEEQARLHHEIQRNATRSVLLTVEGLGLIGVERAINAAMNTLKDTVNESLDFALL